MKKAERDARDLQLREACLIDGITTGAELRRTAIELGHKISERRARQLLEQWSEEARGWRYGMAKQGWETTRRDIYLKLGRIRSRLYDTIMATDRPAGQAMCSTAYVGISEYMDSIVLRDAIPNGIMQIVDKYEGILTHYGIDSKVGLEDDSIKSATQATGR